MTGCMALLLVVCYLNWKYEVIAFHPFSGDGQAELKVMTWNVHCSNGADKTRQCAIAELILKEDIDFVLLNEYNQDSCMVIDSLLKMRYLYTIERKSHQKSGDIFYSKRTVSNSGRLKTPKKVKHIKTINATIASGSDSVQIYGVHFASNHYDEGIIRAEEIKEFSSYRRYKEAQKERSRQTYWIKEDVLKSKHPVIVMGDMNDFNCSAPLDTLASYGLMDAWWKGGLGYGATFHDGWLKLRIDHILHSKELKLESIKVIETDLSDHNPLVAGFSLIKK